MIHQQLWFWATPHLKGKVNLRFGLLLFSNFLLLLSPMKWPPHCRNDQSNCSLQRKGEAICKFVTFAWRDLWRFRAVFLASGSQSSILQAFSFLLLFFPVLKGHGKIDVTMGKGEGGTEKGTKRIGSVWSFHLKSPQGAPRIYPPIEPGQDPKTCFQGIGANRKFLHSQAFCGFSMPWPPAPGLLPWTRCK